MEEFEAWYRAQHQRVLASCAALAGDLDAARDATDEAFARALEHWATVAHMSAPGGWVQTVALNVLRRTMCRRHFVPHRSAPWAAPSHQEVPLPDPDLWAAVRTLPHRQQVAVVLRYVHDLPEVEVASLMGIRRGTVASTLAAARASLGRQLDKPHLVPSTRAEEEHTHG